MSHNTDPIAQPRSPLVTHAGPIEQMLKRYNLQNERLFGFLLELSYEECNILTCDRWKIRCGGSPQGLFVFLKLGPETIQAHPELGHHLILGRILNSTPLPVEEEILLTLLELHKFQVTPDPITNAELQWSGLKTRILGTYYDDPNAAMQVSFGSDLDLFLSPHFYEIYSPTEADLNFLLNLHVLDKPRHPIGRLRYSESLSFRGLPDVPIMISPLDLIGYRTGILGMTRLGKSNALKILADILIRSGLNVGVLIFDPSGEYSYLNEQDHTSLFLLHRNRSVRYSLNPRLADGERELGLHLPQRLGVNFFEQIALGHAIIAALYDAKFDKRPDYIQPLLTWEVIDPENIDDCFPDYGERTRYRRSLSMYLALLARTGYKSPPGMTVDLCLNRALRQALTQDGQLNAGIAKTDNHGEIEISERQSLHATGRIYQQLYLLQQRESTNTALFPPSKQTGMAYFDLLQLALLRMLGDLHISGPKKLAPFMDYHHPLGSNMIRDIVTSIDHGRVVILDLSNADEDIAALFSQMICRAVLKNQVDKFAHNRLGDHFVHFLFEEAHRLFPQDDRNLNNVYNVLGKEGAKYHIGMIYATQSIATISPDLLKNSENLIVTHLGDDREIKILSNRIEFKDLASSIQKARTRGFARVITLSNRFVIPVQIHKFGPPATPAVPVVVPPGR